MVVCSKRRDTNLVRKGALSALFGWLCSSLILASGGCTQPLAPAQSPTANKAAEASSKEIATTRLERRTLSLVVRQPGTIQAFEQTPILAKIAGYVRKWNVDIGDRVHKGDVLAELWVPELAVELRQKEALVQQGEAEILQAKETASAAQASLRSAQATVKEAESRRLRAQADFKQMRSQYERLASVEKSGVLDKVSIEETRHSSEAAEAGLQEVEAKVKSAEAARDESAAKYRKYLADVTVAEAHLQVAKENRDQVQAMLSYTKLTAPYDGVVIKRFVATDHFVQPATGPRAEPLFVVERVDLVRVLVEVPEAAAGWIQRGDKARIHVQVLVGQDFVGEVTRTSFSLDRSARTLIAEIDLPNPKDQLRPGMYVSAIITALQPDVLALPTSAVITQGDVTQGYQSFCFLVENGKATRTPVQIGRNDGQFVEILKRQKPGSTEWINLAGSEVVAAKAGEVTEGQMVNLR
jgi:RND family efflux transporter MFP subunit